MSGSRCDQRDHLCIGFLLAIAVGFWQLSDINAAEAPGAWRGQSLTEFTDAENKEFSWQVVNDGVMGGKSIGNLEFTSDATMHFWGTLSLENNGGFSTARSGGVAYDLSNDLGLLLLVKGDGRTYEARLDSTAKYRGNAISFAGRFQTEAGKWKQVKIPFGEFVGSWRGRKFPDAKLDAANISRVGILLADKKSGPFDLEIQWIRTYGKGKGKLLIPSKVGDGGTEAEKDQQPQKIIPSLEADSRFTIFKRALDAAGLTTFFQWDNPLTVFAPTDEAFAELPEGLLDELLKPAMRDKLVALLAYHVVPGAFARDDLARQKNLRAVRGGSLAVRGQAEKLFVNDAPILPTAIQCTDGVVHPIDAVLLPPTE